MLTMGLKKVEITRLRVSDNTSNGQKRREDITSWMFSATGGIEACQIWRMLTCVALEVGQVIRAPDFSFLDALGALEIMDPKTDSGMIVGDEDANEQTDVQSLLPEEVIWIMDQLLAREVKTHFHLC